MKDKISKAEAKELQQKQGFTLENLRDMFYIYRTRKQTFTVEHERQYGIKILNPISNLNQRERERVLLRAIKLNRV